LQLRILELETLLPARENQARQAALREAEGALETKWQAALDKAARSAAEISSLRSRLRKQAECDVVKLAIAMARRILHREVTMDRDALASLLRTALSRIDQREAHSVRVRPEDAGVVAAFLERIGCPQKMEVTPDATLERGALILETEHGQLDASIETQLSEIERGFADLLADS
jgi:flagellar assembly protein FliH